MSDPGGRLTGDLGGLAVLVTGAASGIGAATCRLFASYGARVAALGRTLADLEATVEDVTGAVAVAADVAQPEQVRAAFDEVDRRLGGIDAVVHAAGVDDVVTKQRVHEQTSAGRPIDVVADLSDEQWRSMVSVNLDGSFYVLRAALRSLRGRAASGSVVLIGSETGVHGLPGLAHYAATKGGVHALVRSAAKEAIGYGVRVNGIAPGVIDTPMSRRSQGVFGGTAAVAPIGRAGAPEEIAKVAAFLCSDLASYVVGEVVNVDGGRMAS